MLKRRPFDDLIDLLKQLPTVNSAVAAPGLGGIPLADTIAEDDIYQLLIWLAAWQRTSRPKLNESHICVFASSYADYEEQAQLATFIEGAGKGQEPISKLCKERGVGLRVLEMAPETPHIVSENWPEAKCMAATAFGMEATAAGGDILGLASISPGNEYYCPPLCQLLIKIIHDEKQKTRTAGKGKPLSITILELMKNEAGREVAAMVGAMIAARSRSLPVLVEGWSGIAALCILSAIDSGYADHVKVASIEGESQSEILSALGLQPIIGGTVNLGAGCGIAIALSAIAPLLNLID